MFKKARRFLVFVVLAAGLAPAWAVESASLPGPIATDRVAAEQPERERLKALVARPEVARKLQALGVVPEEARARIDALTDEEVNALAARIEAAPAGGLSTQEWLLVIIAILLLIIVL
jgi:hypothetical protein